MKNQHTARREQLSYDIEVEVQRTALEAHSNVKKNLYFKQSLRRERQQHASKSEKKVRVVRRSKNSFGISLRRRFNDV